MVRSKSNVKYYAKQIKHIIMRKDVVYLGMIWCNDIMSLNTSDEGYNNGKKCGQKGAICGPNIRLMMANQQAVSPFGILEHVPVDIDEVRTFADFAMIEIVDDSCPYPTLLGIDWAFNNSTIFDLKKRRLIFKGNRLKFIGPVDPDEGCRYTKPIREEERAYELENIHKLTTRQHDYINPTTNGNISWRSESACSSYLEEALENCQNKMYEVSTRRCAS
jgi:hypothetical protein